LYRRLASVCGIRPPGSLVAPAGWMSQQDRLGCEPAGEVLSPTDNNKKPRKKHEWRDI
jgi:hypothetical protein